MSYRVISNKKNIIEKNGKYEFEHVLVQELDQDSINAIVETNTSTRDNTDKFLKEFKSYEKQTKEMVKANIENKVKEAQEFLDGITDENKTKLALEYFEKLIESKKKLISEEDKILKSAYKEVDKRLGPEKMQVHKAHEDAVKTLELWEKYYVKKKKSE